MSNLNNNFIDKFPEGGSARSNFVTRVIYGSGTEGELPLFYRFVVLETIFDPTIIDEHKLQYYEKILGVSNMQHGYSMPRNTIVATRVMAHNTSASTPPMFLFPFFPPTMSFPCQPGEHVWVMFENQSGTKNDLGYWFCRIVGPGHIEDVNHTHAPREFDPSFNPGTIDQFNGTTDAKYELRNGRVATIDGERFTIAESAMLSDTEDAYEKLRLDTEASKLITYEPIPRYRKRPSDVAFEGNNNTLIVLGRDRTGAVAKYDTHPALNAKMATGVPENDDILPGAGAIDIVVGRGQTDITGGKQVETTTIGGKPLGFKEIGKAKNELVENEGDPNFTLDRSRVYIAQRTKVDRNFLLDGFNEEMDTGQFQGPIEEFNSVKDSDSGDGAIVIKSDKIRLIARADLEIVVMGQAERDTEGRIVESTNFNDHAAIVIKANGDIVFRPSDTGYIKLGGDNADKAILCTDKPAIAVAGDVSADPIISTGLNKIGTRAKGQGSWASRVLVVGPTIEK